MMKNILVLTLGLLVCLIVISLYKNGYLELVTFIIMFVFVYGVVWIDRMIEKLTKIVEKNGKSDNNN